MAVHFTQTLTRGTFSFGGLTYYGWNAVAPFGSITSAVYRSWDLVDIQWASDNTLQVEIDQNTGNGRWGYIQINSTKFLRPDAAYQYSAENRSQWVWSGVSNPFPSSGNYTIRIGYENPDTGVTVTAPTTISNTATEFSITVNGIDSPYEVRLYGVALSDTDTSEIAEVGTHITPFNTTTGALGPNVALTVDSNLPLSGSNRTYYLYAARNGPTGGAGGTENEGVAAWIRTGISFTVARDSGAANITLTPEPRTPGAYGLRVFNSSGVEVVDISSRVPRFVTRGTATVPANSSTNISVSGMVDNSTWQVYLVPTTSTTATFLIQSYPIIQSGYFTIQNSSNSARSYTYWVLNLG